ncbi:C40 family peptidase [Christiangramia salexigens]|uniref:Glycoside hydrolase n=1 Tax=Christiangramia salexigens TaxID=1913577 RepID=A0A1L3J6P9_9FLAO|nr:C40 family peptidase [Christiangramia salexigens]APG60774.1 glycoside hydrolase [Christiangramia salexigens]
MKISFDFKYYLILIAVILVSCAGETENEKEEDIQEMITSVQQKFSPDKRVALLDIELEKKKENYILKGETNMPEAARTLKAKLDSAAISYTDNIQILPSKVLEGKIHGVIDVSVANLRGEGKHSAELVTQATLGTPVQIWKRTEEWYYIQTPDGYLSWVDHGGITTMDEEEFKAWKTSEKVIYKKTFGQSYKTPENNSKPVTDLVAGAVLELEAEKEDYFKVRYPDGRAAYLLKEEAEIYSKWLKGIESSSEKLVETSEKLMGLPYLWGGTSAKGVDCSGFTKTIFFMNGMVVPRDASQQVREGKLVDSKGDFDKLKVGDLLFFGRPATDTTSEKVVHVGMWIGNNEFIHSSGDVHISSMDKAAENFDEFNKSRYLRTKRYLGEKSSGLAYLKDQDLYFAQQTDSL